MINQFCRNTGGEDMRETIMSVHVSIVSHIEKKYKIKERLIYLSGP